MCIGRGGGAGGDNSANHSTVLDKHWTLWGKPEQSARIGNQTKAITSDTTNKEQQSKQTAADLSLMEKRGRETDKLYVASGHQTNEVYCTILTFPGSRILSSPPQLSSISITTPAVME